MNIASLETIANAHVMTRTSEPFATRRFASIPSSFLSKNTYRSSTFFLHSPPYFLLLKKARRLRQTTFHHVEHNDTQFHDVIILDSVQLNHFELAHSASRCGAML